MIANICDPKFVTEFRSSVSAFEITAYTAVSPSRANALFFDIEDAVAYYCSDTVYRVVVPAYTPFTQFFCYSENGEHYSYISNSVKSADFVTVDEQILTNGIKVVDLKVN